MIYLELFLSFLQVGLFSVGGGYAAMPIIQSSVVEKYGWLTMSEFTDLITIAEMTPGPIAINSATFVGVRIAGVAGAVVATLGCILPSCVIVSLLALVYMKYRSVSVVQNVLGSLRPAVVALIASAGLTILINVVFASGVISVSNIQWLGLILFAAAFFALRKFKLNPILVMVVCGAVSLAVGLVKTFNVKLKRRFALNRRFIFRSALQTPPRMPARSARPQAAPAKASARPRR